MKKSNLIPTIIILLLTLFSSSVVKAYVYFTIHFSDGTKSEAFYATDVDSICYSKIGLDSLEYADWQVQEIYTCDSVYRYPLEQIDSLCFKDMDEKTIAEKIAEVSKSVIPIYVKCNSTSELVPYMSSLNKIEGVERVWTDDQTLFVKLENWNTLFFYYPSEQTQSGSPIPPLTRALKYKLGEESHQHIPTDAKSICIVYQMINAHQFEEETTKDCINLKDECERYGLETRFNDAPSPDFFKEDIFDYDMVFINTHGIYNSEDKMHWLSTGEKLGDSKEASSFDSLDSLDKYLDEFITEWVYKKFNKNHPSALEEYFSYMWVKEKQENGNWRLVCYTIISEKFINSSSKIFKNPGKAIFFNSACQSLKGDNGNDSESLANIFVKKGAGCYLGYNNTNIVGIEAGCRFFRELLNGKYVGSAFKSLSDRLRNDNGYAKLKMIPDNSSLCLSSPLTLDYSTDDDSNYKLKGSIKMLNTPELVSSYKYGFQLSTNPDMSQPDEKEVEPSNYDDATLYMNWEKTLNNSDLQPDITYYYRAYMNDGYNYCYGAIRSLDNEPYVVISNDTITFYYDNKKGKRSGTICEIEDYYYYDIDSDDYHYPQWLVDNIKYALFDASFAEYYPTSTAYWFVGLDLSSIQHLEYLNTSNVTDMNSMFFACESLTSLDLSSFNTSNVTDMSWMFGKCSSLTSLDLSSFNTSNVTDMSWMFVDCSSLTSLDLSSFNTSNVTDMSFMFEECSSLTSLDLRSFNTSNVTDMFSMFQDCSSLTSLDLSSFNISNVADIGSMFAFCSSLKTIYSGNWTVLDYSLPFVGCVNLVGGRGTKIGVNLYGYDNKGRPLYYYCPDDNEAAHIDGGKDNPGLFTAK